MMIHWKGRVYRVSFPWCRRWRRILQIPASTSRWRSSLLTLTLGCAFLVVLHVLISREIPDEALYFASLPIPDDDPRHPPLEEWGGSVTPEGEGEDEDPIPPVGGGGPPPRMARRLHQTWKTELVPHSMTAWIKSWTRNHPGWEYWLWTDSSARQLIKERFPALLPVYDGYPANIQRADALRYVVLHEFGGVYADLDMESLKPLDPLVSRYACFVGQEPFAHPILDTNTRTLVINALMGCRERHPFLAAVLEELPNFAHMWSLLDSTGPHFLSYVFKKYNARQDSEHLRRGGRDDDENATFLAPAEFFYPNLDPDKFEYFYKKCADYGALSSLQKRACQSLKRRPSERERRSVAFSVHHWVHTYLSVKVSLRKPMPIEEVVPHVRIYAGAGKWRGGKELKAV